jgi:hypothetical protein
MAGGLSELGLYYICGVLAAVIVALFGLLVRSWYLRLRDARDLLREVLRHLDANTDAAAELARAVLAKFPRLRKMSENQGSAGSGGGPVSPPSQHGPVGGNPPGI